MSFQVDWQRVLPVLVSIGIIIAIAILRNYSKTFAAIAATMPINIPLGLWIVATGDDQVDLVGFSQSLVINIIPTLFFLVVVWFAFRLGWTLIPAIAVGYVAWGITLAISYWLRGG